MIAKFGRMLGPTARFLTRNRIRVLMYHRFSTRQEARKIRADRFEEQLIYIKRHFTPIALPKLAALVLEGARLPARPLAITVDDGNRDFVDIAYPLLRKHGIPASYFVVTNYVFGETWLWFDKLRYAIFATQSGSLRTRLGSLDIDLAIGDAASREKAWNTVATAELAASTVAREEMVLQVARELGVELPEQPPQEFAAATIADLRGLDPEVVQIGSHTANHVILSRCDARELGVEIGQANARLEGALQRPVEIFCYPNGMPEDINADAVAAVMKAGFKLATVAYGGIVSPSAFRKAPYLVPRVSAPDNLRDLKNNLNGSTYLRERFG